MSGGCGIQSVGLAHLERGVSVSLGQYGRKMAGPGGMMILLCEL